MSAAGHPAPVVRAFHKVLVANRGEIACRVLRACREAGLATVAVHSSADRAAPHVGLADEAVELGGAAAAESYLSADRVIEAARATGADAVHPGYGFLSENAAFAGRCAREGLVFVGPSAAAMDALGNKARVKELLAGTEVPLIPGYAGRDQSPARLRREAAAIGYPVLLKAAAGGGGKGMRVVRAEAELEHAVSAARAEAANSFGSDELLLERYFDACRHVEVQVFGDSRGGVVALGERDCSVQRRYQKVVEECPSPFVDAALRRRMAAAACAIARRAAYSGAGTCEFLVDSSRRFYFLEVNTRLQVEHPVTEAVYGVDLVRLQLAVAAGARLADALPPHLRGAEAPAPRGHAIEARLYAEDPARDFFPCTGRLLRFEVPPGVRCDAGVREGGTVAVHYDPMLAKVIAHGATRDEAARRLADALRRAVVLGVVTNKDFLVRVLRDDEFLAGGADTRFLERRGARLAAAAAPLPPDAAAGLAAAAALWDWDRRAAARPALRHIRPGWGNVARPPRELALALGDGTAVRLWYAPARPEPPADSRSHSEAVRLERPAFEVRAEVTPPGAAAGAAVPAARVVLVACCRRTGRVALRTGGVLRTYAVASAQERVRDADELVMHVHAAHLSPAGTCFSVTRRSRFAAEAAEDGAGGVHTLAAPIPCKILRVEAAKGGALARGDLAVVVESMKMEMKLFAEHAGVASEVLVAAGDVVKEGTPLLRIDSRPAQK